MSMSTRRAKLSNVIMPEEPAKLQPCQKIVDEKEHLPEDDNEEWEEVLVGSYIPLPVIWDEHPTAQKLEKLIEKMEFQVHQEPVPNIASLVLPLTLDNKCLSIIVHKHPHSLVAVEFERTSAGYKKIDNDAQLWNEVKMETGRGEIVMSP